MSAYPNHRRDCAYVVSTGPAPCTCDYYDRPECEHDWELVPDWYGDPNVINGTRDCSYKRCRKCGEEADLELGERPPVTSDGAYWDHDL